jgi:hypothetical protein
MCLSTFNDQPPTSQELYTFHKNRSVNPRTNAEIVDKTIFTYLLSTLESFFFRPHKNKKDPILLEKIPRRPGKPIFEYPWAWEPLTGEIVGLDPHGGLFFDPDTLIHYFYTKRLNHLWVISDDTDFEPFFGDALGTGPEFYVPSRGCHPDWYLFRLPLMFKYLPSGFSYQIPILMPLVSDADLKLLDELGSKYGKSYKQRFGNPRPSLVKMKELYEKAVDPFPNIELSAEECRKNPELAEKERRKVNRQAVNELRYM